MIGIPLGATTFAALRFTADPLWEIATGVAIRYQPTSQRSWLHRPFLTSPGWDSMRPAHLELLAAALEDRTFVPDLLTPLPTRPWSDSGRSARDRVQDVSSAPLEVAESDLATLRQGPAAAYFEGWSPDRLREELGGAILGAWDAVLAPLWSRMSALLTADIRHHSTVLARDGVLASLADLDPRVRVAGQRLEVRLGEVDDAVEEGPLWLVPSILAYPGVLVSWGGPATVIAYGARGAGRLWEAAEEGRDGLTGLMGRTRAGLLVVLGVPRSTSDLAHGHSLAPSTVNEHLRVLEAAGLVHAQRDGRKVLYGRTELGDALMEGATR